MSAGLMIATIGGALNVYIIVEYALKDYRNRRSSALLLLLFLIFYPILIYVQDYLGEKNIAVIMELGFVMYICITFLKGYSWRNYFFMLVGCFAVNIAFYILCSMNEYLANIYYKEEMIYYVSAWEGLVDAMVCITLSLLMSYPLRKLYKIFCKLNERLYTFFAFLFVFVQIFQLAVRNEIFHATNNLKAVQMAITVVFVLFSFAFATGFMFLYDRIEKRRIEKERENLKNIIRKEYEALTREEGNDTPRIRTGNIMLDSVIGGYSKIFETQKMIFEEYIEPVGIDIIDKNGIATIIDNLLAMVNEGVELSENSFVKLELRRVNGVIILKLETSRGIVFKRQQLGRSQRVIQKKYSLIKDLCDLQESIIYRQAFADTCEIGIIIPQ